MKICVSSLDPDTWRLNREEKKQKQNKKQVCYEKSDMIWVEIYLIYMVLQQRVQYVSIKQSQCGVIETLFVNKTVFLYL